MYPNQDKLTVLEASLHYTRAGLRVLPVRGDGTKRPACNSWGEYQRRVANVDELNGWFGDRNDVGIGVVAGQGVEVLDFDRPGVFEQFREVVEDVAPGLVESLPRVITPSGGAHLYYRCETAGPNDKLAKDEKGKTLIETRGEGGYVVAPPSPACCHEANKPYTQVGGPALPEIPEITPEQRELLLDAARSFNRQAQIVVDDPHRETAGRQRPGDAYNAAASWHKVLEPAGWSIARENGGVVYWRRPGNTGLGHSATTGYCGDYFYCFSSNGAPFEAEKAYSKFAAYALLYHAGNYTAASRALSEHGYGTPPLPERLRLLPRPAGLMKLPTTPTV